MHFEAEFFKKLQIFGPLPQPHGKNFFFGGGATVSPRQQEIAENRPRTVLVRTVKQTVRAYPLMGYNIFEMSLISTNFSGFKNFLTFFDYPPNSELFGGKAITSTALDRCRLGVMPILGVPQASSEFWEYPSPSRKNAIISCE